MGPLIAEPKFTPKCIKFLLFFCYVLEEDFAKTLVVTLLSVFSKPFLFFKSFKKFPPSIVTTLDYYGG